MNVALFGVSSFENVIALLGVARRELGEVRKYRNTLFNLSFVEKIIIRKLFLLFTCFEIEF